MTTYSLFWCLTTSALPASAQLRVWLRVWLRVCLRVCESGSVGRTYLSQKMWKTKKIFSFAFNSLPYLAYLTKEKNINLHF